MKTHHLLAASLFVSASLASGAVGAAQTTLTFDGDNCGGPCGNGTEIDQSYGDGVGVDVIYNGDVDGGSGVSMFYWPDYGSLLSVAYAAQFAVGEIFLKPVGGSTITLLGFDLSSWGEDFETSYRILDGLGNMLFDSGDIVVGATVLNVTGNFVSTDGIKIQFGPDAYNVGIDNIAFDVEGGTLKNVPLPAAGTGLPLIAALGAFWAWRRKRAFA